MRPEVDEKRDPLPRKADAIATLVQRLSAALPDDQKLTDKNENAAAATIALLSHLWETQGNPIVVHGEMRKRIAALEETIAKLPTAPGGPLNDNEIEENKKEIARLKTLPPVPAQPPTDAIKAESKWRERGEKVLLGLATTAVSEASKALWARYGDQLIDAAKAIGEWIASLNLPSA